MVDIFVLAWNSCCIESMVGQVLWTLVSPAECKSSSTWDSLVLSSLPSLPPSLGNWLLVPSPLLSCPTPWCWSSSASLWPLNESAEWKDGCNERAANSVLPMKGWLLKRWFRLQGECSPLCAWKGGCPVFSMKGKLAPSCQWNGSCNERAIAMKGLLQWTRRWLCLREKVTSCPRCVWWLSKTRCSLLSIWLVKLLVSIRTKNDIIETIAAAFHFYEFHQSTTWS